MQLLEFAGIQFVVARGIVVHVPEQPGGRLVETQQFAGEGFTAHY